MIAVEQLINSFLSQKSNTCELQKFSYPKWRLHTLNICVKQGAMSRTWKNLEVSILSW